MSIACDVQSKEAAIACEANQRNIDTIQFTRFVEYKHILIEIMFTRINSIGGIATHDPCISHSQHFTGMCIPKKDTAHQIEGRVQRAKVFK